MLSHFVTKRLSATILLCVLAVLMGFMPWERLFSIQILNHTLIFFFSYPFGLMGLIGLLIIATIKIGKTNKWFTFFGVVLFAFLIVLASVMLVLGLIFYNLGWQDTGLYRNGNQYLIIQEYNAFTTTEVHNFKVIKTQNPLGIIRFVDEEANLPVYDTTFNKNTATYRGKTWIKVK